jgi:hypothetical protein
MHMNQFAPHACPNKQAIWDEEGGSPDMFGHVWEVIQAMISLSCHLTTQHDGPVPRMHNVRVEIMVIFLSFLYCVA